MAIRLILGGIFAITVLAMAGVLSFMSPIAEGIYEAAYGKPMPHRDGSGVQQINDWLSFLPPDPTTRALIVCGFLLGLLALRFLVGLVTMRFMRFGRSRRARAEARMRAVNSYNVTKQ